MEPLPEVPIVPEMDEKKSKNKRKGKSAEEKVMEGGGYWTRMCESQGDFETPEAQASRDQDTATLQKEEEELLPRTEEETPEPESPENDAKLKVPSILELNTQMLNSRASMGESRKMFADYI